MLTGKLSQFSYIYETDTKAAIWNEKKSILKKTELNKGN